MVKAKSRDRFLIKKRVNPQEGEAGAARLKKEQVNYTNPI
jgi:hypothetical protein